MVRKVLLAALTVALFAFGSPVPASAATAQAGCGGRIDTDLPIPDESTVESRITLFLCPSGQLTGTIEIHIVHPYIGDLMVNLIDPDGNITTLHAGSGGDADNIDRVYGVSFLDGADAMGTWRLQITDMAAGDTGYLDWWAIDLPGP